MTQAQLLHEFGQLDISQQLELLREALRLIRPSAVVNSAVLPRGPSKSSLSDAAALLLDDYTNDAELVSFTALDGEPIHATR